jgi:metal-sulfur cluster biosynthetic enzyme
LRSITDPEHPVSLEQLRVVNPDDIKVSGNRVLVYLTPTIPHCSMSTLIGEWAFARQGPVGRGRRGAGFKREVDWRL